MARPAARSGDRRHRHDADAKTGSLDVPAGLLLAAAGDRAYQAKPAPAAIEAGASGRGTGWTRPHAGPGCIRSFGGGHLFVLPGARDATDYVGRALLP